MYRLTSPGLDQISSTRVAILCSTRISDLHITIYMNSGEFRVLFPCNKKYMTKLATRTEASN